jgi:hypothetical protein
MAWHPGNPNTTDWILIGAHYDHVFNCPGANDNAASVGVVLETMHRLAETAHDCHVMAVFFDTEEPPYFDTENMGSHFFYRHVPVGFEMDRLRCAIILDLVGHEVMLSGREQALFVIGVDSGELLPQVAREAAAVTELQVFLATRGINLSDNLVFDDEKRPHLFLSAGVPYHYHTPEDTFDKIAGNLEKLHHVSLFLHQLCLQLKPLQESGRSAQFTIQDEYAELERFLGIEEQGRLETVFQKIAPLIRARSGMSDLRLLHVLAALMKSRTKRTKQQIISDFSNVGTLLMALEKLMSGNER